MQKWTDMGHAMRRRIGAPMNHLEAAEACDDRSHETSEEQYSKAEAADSVRIPMGREEKEEGHEMNSDAQDADDYTGTVGATVPGSERMGARYQVSESTAMTVDPTLGPTMANAKIVPSVHGRQNVNFQNAISEQY